MNRARPHRWPSLLAFVGILIFSLAFPTHSPIALASHTPEPASVNLVGSLESEATAGACGDWDPGCAGAKFTAKPNSVYLFESAAIPAGDWEYKVALGSWAENYGANFQQDGPNISLSLGASRSVRFYYDHKTHYIADNVRNTIYTLPGNFGPAIGCSEWAPDCLASLMSDVDGDGVFTFVTDEIPAGNYEFKVATNESWSNPNYGVGGGPDNVQFSVAGSAIVTFSFNTANNTPSVIVEPTGLPSENNVEWDGLRHDSRDTLYRTPGGAVPAGTPVTLRLRTFHNDVTAVTLRLYDLELNGQRLLPMSLAASDVSCYQADLEDASCDFWAVTLSNAAENNLWYRFIVTDGSDIDYYADNTGALDGGLGATTDDPVDNSFALMVYAPGFQAPAWARKAVIYQIFPDRFRNGRNDNDPHTGDVRYDDPVIKLPWNTLPEGYCRNYAGATTATCPWRFGAPPGAPANQLEQPRGRDYMGGDLKGVDQMLDYLWAEGVNTIYFNPVFDAGSNHSYDTQDYYKIDPYFGSQKDWENLVKHAKQRGIRIILDGVFNHMSSDSPLFDRYGHYPTVGACESTSSQYRTWFSFQDVPAGTGTCAGSAGPKSAIYDGWFGFDSIPVLNKANPNVQAYFLTNSDSVSKHWLNGGAGGWRLDVSGDPSFPDGYWETFRQVSKSTRSDALLISETWQKDSTLLRMLRGDRLDTTMNYRLRDAVLGLLAPGAFDSKGFADSGRVIEPSEFLARLQSVREDYPDAAYYSLMNLLDSHDTERLRWTLTPGSETTAGREQNAANVAEGKQRQKLASLIQFSVPGAPTVYYGDEAGITGDDDPDDRRTFPWPDLGGSPDLGLAAHYAALAGLRQLYPALTDGDFRALLADDDADTVAFGRATGSRAAIVAINRSGQSRTLSIPVAGYLPEGTSLLAAYGVGNPAGGNVTVAGGKVSVTLAPLSGLLLVSGQIDRTPPAAPTNLAVASEGDGVVSLSWNAVSGAAGYNVYRSPLSGGGWVKANGAPLTGTSFADAGLRNAQTYYYVVRALDAAGNESKDSNEVAGLPHYTIGWANLQWPPTLNHTISTTDRTDNVYGQVWIDGVTNQPGATEGLRAQLGFGSDGSNPAGNSSWTWVEASFNVNAGNNDEFVASLLPEALGTYDYAYRYSTTGGRDWIYADLDGIGNGYSPAQAGSLTVESSGDTTAPATPTGLQVVSASPAGIELVWDVVAGDPTLYGYEVRRSDAAGGPYTTIALVTDASYTDTSVAEGTTYFYVVRAIDMSFNRSAHSDEVDATAELRTVTLVFNVTVPATTDATGRSVYIAGFLDRLDGDLPQWDPGGVVLARVDATHWSITFTGKETTQIEYKYTLGDWEHVEKDGACGEINNRQLTLSYGTNGTQTVNDIVLNWRSVTPCEN
jgi:glycosidase